jgi:hypothetical protein
MEANAVVLGTVSPDGRWLSVYGATASMTTLVSIDDGHSVPLFVSTEPARLRWSPDRRYAYLSIQYIQQSAFGVGTTYALPIEPGSGLPRIPPGGFKSEDEIAALPGVVAIQYGDVAPGSSPSVYAYSRITTTRNLYRIPLRD